MTRDDPRLSRHADPASFAHTHGSIYREGGERRSLDRRTPARGGWTQGRGRCMHGEAHRQTHTHTGKALTTPPPWEKRGAVFTPRRSRAGESPHRTRRGAVAREERRRGGQVPLWTRPARPPRQRRRRLSLRRRRRHRLWRGERRGRGVLAAAQRAPAARRAGLGLADRRVPAGAAGCRPLPPATRPRHVRDTSATRPRHTSATASAIHVSDTSATLPRHFRDTSATRPR